MVNIERKPRIFGVAGTILFWALFVLLSTVFSLFARKPIYKTVQIRLDSPQPKMQEARAAAAPKSAEKAVEPAKVSPPPAAQQNSVAQQNPPAQQKPAQAQPAPSKPAKTQPKKAAQKTQDSAPKKSEPQKQVPARPAKEKPKTEPTTKPAPKKIAPEPVLVEDPMAAFNNQTAAKPKKQLTQEEMDALFASSEANTSASTTNAPATVKEIAALSGNAGSASTAPNTATSATSSNPTTSPAASAGTSDALTRLAATQYTKTSGNGVSSTTNVKTGGTSDGKVTMQMSDGSARTLLDPATPSITLSNAAALLIDGKKQVQIRFTVTAAGTVPVSDIRITPESILHPIVRSEIANQISRWRFSSASSAGTAVFDYTITVK